MKIRSIVFFSNSIVDSQTDKQTDRQTNARQT